MPDPARVTRDGSYCYDVGGCFVVGRVPNPGRNLWLSRRPSRHENWIVLEPQVKQAGFVPSRLHHVVNVCRVAAVAAGPDGLVSILSLPVRSQQSTQPRIEFWRRCRSCPARIDLRRPSGRQRWKRQRSVPPRLRTRPVTTSRSPASFAPAKTTLAGASLVLSSLGQGRRCLSVRRNAAGLQHDAEHNMTPIRIRVVALALSIAFGSVGCAGTTERSAKDQNASVTISSSMMADGKEWTTANLNVSVSPSYCYNDAEPNCRRYGRLYTWESAQRVCQSLGDGWRLPTDDEWRQMAKRYGGVSDDSADKGRAAFTALAERRHVRLQCRPGRQPLRWTVRPVRGARVLLDGIRQRSERAPRITTSVKTAKLSTVSPRVRSRWLFPCGVSGVTAESSGPRDPIARERVRL